MVYVKRGTMIINISKFPKKRQPTWGDETTKREATRAYVASWMKGARKKTGFYRGHGAKKIKFVFGNVKEIRKI